MAEIGDAHLPSATADVVSLAAVYNDDAEPISPYGSASAAMGDVDGRSGQRVVSYDFGVMNLDRRTNPSLQARNDTALSGSSRNILSLSTAIGVGASQRGLGFTAASANASGGGSSRMTRDDDLDSSLHTGHHTMTMEHPSQRSLLMNTNNNNNSHSHNHQSDDDRRRHSDAETRLSLVEQSKERTTKFSPEELKEFSSNDRFVEGNNVSAVDMQHTVAPTAAIAAAMSDNNDVLQGDRLPTTAATAIAAEDVIVVPNDGSNTSTKLDASGPKGLQY